MNNRSKVSVNQQSESHQFSELAKKLFSIPKTEIQPSQSIQDNPKLTKT